MPPTFSEPRWKESSSLRSGEATVVPRHSYALSSHPSQQQRNDGNTTPGYSQGGGTPMYSSFSNDSSSLHPLEKSLSQTSSVALPPLRSLVDLEGGLKSSGLEVNNGRMTVQKQFPLHVESSRLYSSQGASSPVPDLTRSANTVKSSMLLEKIYHLSMDLAHYSQEIPRNGEVPAVNDLNKMQNMATNLDASLRDLRRERDARQGYKYDSGLGLMTQEEGDQHLLSTRRRSSGTASSSALAGALNNLRRTSNGSISSILTNGGGMESAGYTEGDKIRSSITLPRLHGHTSRHSEGDVQSLVRAAEQYSRHPPSNTLSSSSSSSSSFHHHQKSESYDANTATTKTSPSASSLNSDFANTAGESASEGRRANKYRKRSRAPAPGSCLSCGAENTPEWRRGPGGARTLCNACGLHYSKMVRRRKSQDGGEGNVKISIEELRTSVLVPSASINGSDRESTTN